MHSRGAEIGTGRGAHGIRRASLWIGWLWPSSLGADGLRLHVRSAGGGLAHAGQKRRLPNRAVLALIMGAGCALAPTLADREAGATFSDHVHNALRHGAGPHGDGSAIEAHGGRGGHALWARQLLLAANAGASDTAGRGGSDVPPPDTPTAGEPSFIDGAPPAGGDGGAPPPAFGGLFAPAGGGLAGGGGAGGAGGGGSGTGGHAGHPASSPPSGPDGSASLPSPPDGSPPPSGPEQTTPPPGPNGGAPDNHPAFVSPGPPLQSTPSPAPEPSTWAVMITGLMCVGAALRQRRDQRRTMARGEA